MFSFNAEITSISHRCAISLQEINFEILGQLAIFDIIIDQNWSEFEIPVGQMFCFWGGKAGAVASYPRSNSASSQPYFQTDPTTPPLSQLSISEGNVNNKNYNSRVSVDGLSKTMSPQSPPKKNIQKGSKVMVKFNAENVRIRNRYEIYLKEAKGQDEKSIDKVRTALLKFEESTKFKPFKKFHIDQARHFKKVLAQAKGPRGKPLSLTTIDATLRLVKGFFHWLADKPGFKSVLTFGDVDYFNNNRNDARAAHAQRPIQYPSTQAAYHAFQAMQEQTEIQRRDKAMFAFVMITGARAGAVASLRLKHINLIDGHVYQDGREVNTKAGKTINTWFFPMHPDYLAFFTEWVTFLRDIKFFGAEDALFPKPEQRLIDGKFSYDRLSHDPYANSAQVNAVFRGSFAQVQMYPYTPHSIRKTLGQEMSDRNLPLDAQKAWSQNLGHEKFTTTVSSYLPVSSQRQGELIKGLVRYN